MVSYTFIDLLIGGGRYFRRKKVPIERLGWVLASGIIGILLSLYLLENLTTTAIWLLGVLLELTYLRRGGSQLAGMAGGSELIGGPGAAPSRAPRSDCRHAADISTCLRISPSPPSRCPAETGPLHVQNNDGDINSGRAYPGSGKGQKATYAVQQKLLAT